MTLRHSLFQRAFALLCGGVLLAAVVLFGAYAAHFKAVALKEAEAYAAFLAEQSAKPLFFDDRLALRSLLSATANSSASYAWLERDGAPLVHTFNAGFPRGLQALHTADASAMVWEDMHGKRFIDIVAPVPRFPGAALHLGLSIDLVNKQIRDVLPAWIGIGVAVLLLGALMSRRMAMLITENVEFSQRKLRESEARFRATFEQAAVGIAHVALDGNWLQVNDRLCEIVGYERQALLQLTFQDIAYPADLEADLVLAQKLIARELPSYSIEKRLVRQGGATVWVNMTVSLAHAATGEAEYGIVVVEDIQRRKEAEAALASHQRLLAERSSSLQATNQSLMAANQQLEGFLYAASHDLKGPLGRLASFSCLLERDYRDRLEGDGLLFLSFIRDNAIRINQLVEDLVTHARINQQECNVQPMDILGAVQAALRDKADDIHDTGTVVRLDLPPVQVLADPYGLSQVLGNLLENALKYSRQITCPTIEIGGKVLAEGFRLWVRDNGIGFGMEYRDKIFEIFRRLHTYAEYPGSGVGLALVKRAMERMGGKVWAESASGQGAVFYLEFQTASQPVAS